MTAIYVNSNIHASKTNFVLKRELGSASCSAEIYINDDKDPKKVNTYLFTSVYYRPNTSHKIDVKQFLTFNEKRDGKKYIFTGDFNDHAAAWSNESHASPETKLSEILMDNQCSLVALNDKSITRISKKGDRPSALDITLVSSSLGGSTWEVLSENLFKSDHYPIYGSFRTGANETPPQEDTFNLDKADWEQLEGLLTNNSIGDISNLNVTEQSACINDKIMEAALLAIPIKQFEGGYRGETWWNEECDKSKMHLRLCSKTLHKCVNGTNLDAWKQAEADYIKTIAKAKLSDWEKTLNEKVTDYRDSKTLWRKVKQKRKGQKPMQRPFIITDSKGNKHIYIGDQAKADSLAETIAKKSQNISLTQKQLDARKRFEESYTDPIPDNTKEFNKSITMAELERAIYDVRDKNKAGGTDRVTYKIIEKLPLCTKEVILQHFNSCLESGTVPDQWKQGQVFALRKQGKDVTSPESYRPISLTPHMGKLFEKIIKERLERFLEEKGAIPQCQSGFRAARSTTDNLVYLTEKMKKALRGKNTARLVTLFDIQKAFDRVWHCKLLSKLKQLEISGNVYNVIKSFLHNRSMTVKHGNAYSKNHFLDMGSPQGSVLSPLLFIILLHDIDKVDIGDNELLLYADDICLISNIVQIKQYGHTIKDKHQKAIDALSEYLEDLGLNFASEKTQFQVVSHDRFFRSDITITVEGKTIKHSTNIKYLGLTFNCELNWKPHFKNITTKVKSHINLLKILGSEYWAKGTKFLVNVARALVRSCTSYGQECFFASDSIKELTKLEYRALLVALGAEKCTKYSEAIYREAGWLTLEEERKLRCAQYLLRIEKLNDPLLKNLTEKEKYHAINEKAYITKGSLQGLVKNSTMTIFEYTDEIFRFSQLAYDKNIEKQVISPLPVREEPVIHTFYTLAPGTKKSDDVLGAGATANLLIDEHFSNLYQVYTDGSVDEIGKCGYGIYFREPGQKVVSSHENNITKSVTGRINDNHCTMTVELWAIYVALWHIKEDTNPAHAKTVILTDSLSSLQALKRKPKKNFLLQSLIKLIIKEINEQGKLVIFCHVPSHANVKGNENADTLAKEGTKIDNEDEIADVLLTRNEAYRILKEEVTRDETICPNLHKRKETKRLEGIFPDGPAEVTRTYRRVKLGTPKFKAYSYYRKEVPKCPHCGSTMNLEHILDVPCKTLKLEFKIEIQILKDKKLSFSAALERDSGDEWMLAYELCYGIHKSSIGHLI